MGNPSTKTKSNTVTTPTAPAWVQQPIQGQVGAINDLAQTDPSQYVTGPSNLQQQAFGNASNLGGWQGTNGQAADIYSGVAGAGPNLIDQTHQADAALLSGMDVNGYMNPYNQAVVDTSLQGYDQNAAMQNAALAAQQAGTQAFGGSRSAIAQALTLGQQGMERGQLEAGLRSGAFDRAMGWMGEDANRQQGVNLFNAGALNNTEQLNQQAQDAYGNRQLGAASGLNSVSNSFAANSQNDVQSQLAAGDVERAIAQAQATGDFSFLQAINQLYGGSGMNQFIGQKQTGTSTTTQNPGILGTIGQVAQTAGSVASLFSDARLKTDVTHVLTDGKGRDWFDYRYTSQGIALGAPEGVHRGVMAQQVLGTDPGAVSLDPSGFLKVDYGALQ